MKQAIYGLLLYVFLILPPVANVLESIMVIHMHMQMPLFVTSGFLMAPFFQIQFPLFFAKWNNNCVPGIILVVMIWIYWMIPRAMDEALTVQSVEIFKFISLPFLVGLPLRDSWKKLSSTGKGIIYVIFIIIFLIISWLYIDSESQLCNNYLLVEQKALGWSSLAIAVCMIIYLVQLIFVDQSEFKEVK
jgi:hypothetical protein